MVRLISFDIDGTLEVGDPPGAITMAMVRRAQALGYIIGSCSDRTISHQERIWIEQDITMAFTVLKHQLERVKTMFEAEQYYHIGDTNIDRYYAEQAGFAFFLPDMALDHFWSDKAATLGLPHIIP